jgi:hypothetical protein
MAYGVTVNQVGQPTVAPGASGNANSVQYKTSTSELGGAAYVEISSQGNLCLHDVAVPTAPAAGRLVLFGEECGGRSMPAYIGPSGLDSILQPFLARNKIGYWSGIGNANTAPLALGIAAPTAAGTATAVNVATTGIAAQTKRLRYQVSPASATAVAGWRLGVAQFWLGNGSGLGGFNLVQRFVPGGNGTPSTQRMFVGIGSSTAAPTDVQPSSITNIIGVGADAADTNLFMMHNDGSGTATRIDLGANFPKNNAGTDLYEIALFAKPNATEVEYQVRRLNTGHEATGTITTDIPSNTTLLAPRGWASVGGTSSTIAIDLISLYIETDY